MFALSLFNFWNLRKKISQVRSGDLGKFSQPISQGKYVTCPHCGHRTNYRGSQKCEACYEDLTGGKEIKKPSIQKNIKSKNLILALFFVGLSGFWVFNLTRPISIKAEDASLDSKTSNFTASLKKARGVIAYAGEPCGRILNDSLGQYIAKLNPLSLIHI